MAHRVLARVKALPVVLLVALGCLFAAHAEDENETVYKLAVGLLFPPYDYVEGNSTDGGLSIVGFSNDLALGVCDAVCT